MPPAFPQASPALDATVAVEIERQWRIPRSLRLPDSVAGWTTATERGELVFDRYYDTDQLCLRDRRARLRVRVGATGEVATLKRRLADVGAARQKLELNGPVVGDPQASAPFLAARLIADGPLIEVGELRTWRTTRIYARDGASVEVIRDRVDSPWGETVWRVEAEGPEGDVLAFAADLERTVAGLKPVRQGKVGPLFDRHRAAA